MAPRPPPAASAALALAVALAALAPGAAGEPEEEALRLEVSLMQNGVQLLGELRAGAAAGAAPEEEAAERQVEDAWRPAWGAENPNMSSWPRLQRLPSDPRIVISLSTVPGGVSGLGPTLRSLRNQTIPADAIELNLPLTSARGLGDYPAPRAGDVEGVQVYRTEDWLALTNLIPTVQRAKARGGPTLVLVVDDDKAYPPSLVEDHLRAHRERPRSASACRGYRMPPHGDISTEVFWPCWDELGHSLYGHQVGQAERVAVVTGSDSWSAPVDLLTDGLWQDLRDKAHDGDGTIKEAASLMNDVWASGQLSRQKVPKFVVPCRWESQSPPKTSKRRSQNLMMDRVALNGRVMKYYVEEWHPEEIMSQEEVERMPPNPEDGMFVSPLPEVSFLSWVGGGVSRAFRTIVLGG